MLASVKYCRILLEQSCTACTVTDDGDDDDVSYSSQGWLRLLMTQSVKHPASLQAVTVAPRAVLTWYLTFSAFTLHTCVMLMVF